MKAVMIIFGSVLGLLAAGPIGGLIAGIIAYFIVEYE